MTLIKGKKNCIISDCFFFHHAKETFRTKDFSKEVTQNKASKLF
jgi:hypothetical protein